MQSIQHVEETRREEGRKRPCESSKTSLDNRQQDQSLDKGAVCISNLCWTKRGFQAGHMWTVNGMKRNSDFILSVGTQQRGKPWALWGKPQQNKGEKIILRTQKKNKPQKSIYYRNQNQFRKLAFPLWYKKIWLLWKHSKKPSEDNRLKQYNWVSSKDNKVTNKKDKEGSQRNLNNNLSV